MNEQIAILAAEKQLTIDEINKNKKELARLRKVILEKKTEVDGKDEIIFALEQKIDALYDEMERLEEEIAMKNAIIKDLERQLNALLNKKPAPMRPKNQFYVPVKGDEVDEQLAAYVNQYGSPVPWKRISVGNYMYGTKKVSVKYMRMHLIIKVGGGSMMVEEFVANYEDIELAKMNYHNPGMGVSVQADRPDLSKQQKIALARGASPRNLGAGMASPKGAKKSL